MSEYSQVRCFHCKEPLPLRGRSLACYLPCCADDVCQRARKRRYVAEWRARKRELSCSNGKIAAMSS
jgi:hypothetical protein